MSARWPIMRADEVMKNRTPKVGLGSAVAEMPVGGHTGPCGVVSLTAVGRLQGPARRVPEAESVAIPAVRSRFNLPFTAHPSLCPQTEVLRPCRRPNSVDRNRVRKRTKSGPRSSHATRLQCCTAMPRPSPGPVRVKPGRSTAIASLSVEPSVVPVATLDLRPRPPQ